MKKVLALLLSAVLLLTVPTLAEGECTLALSSAEGNCGDVVTLELTLENNPGLAACYVRVTYDETRLALLSPRDNGVLNEFLYRAGEGEVILSWEADTFDEYGTGTICLLDFEILSSTASGAAAVTLEKYMNGCVNNALQEVPVSCVSGLITVRPSWSEKLTSTVYTVSELAGQVKNIPAGTSTEAFLQNVSGTGASVVKDGMPVGAAETVGTGMRVRLTDGTHAREYELIVTGDASGDGRITVADLVACRSAILKNRTLSRAALTALDVTGDKTADVADFVKLRAHILHVQLIGQEEDA